MQYRSRHSYHHDCLHERNQDSYMKANHSPTSTIDSQSPRQHYGFSKTSHPQNKEKSQLCKKFIEQGYCPYKQKCKFAHGLHELKKNSQQNTKYKTKQCGVFATQGCCIFGERCNFIHKSHFDRQEKPQAIDLGFWEVKNWKIKQSKLLKILQQ